MTRKPSINRRQNMKIKLNQNKTNHIINEVFHFYASKNDA